MNKSIVIYQSTYGTVKHFAEQIAKELGADLAERKKVKIFELTGYDTVIYGGGIYAGRIAGSKLIRRMYRKFPNKHYVVFSVGFTPHTRPDVLEAHSPLMNLSYY